MLSDMKIITKILGTIGLIAVIFVGTVWFATGRMSTIDGAYSAFIDKDARAVAEARRANRLLITSMYHLYRMIAEAEPHRIKAADTSLDAVAEPLKKTFQSIRDDAPAFAARIDALLVKVDAYFASLKEIRRQASLNADADALTLERQEG